MLNLKDSMLWRIPLCVLMLSSTALAQNNPELGETSRGNAALAPAPAPETSSTTTTTTTTNEVTVATSGTDHSMMIGHFGVGTFGVLSLPTMDCGDTAGTCTPNVAGTLSAPTIGARYWLDEGMAIEAAIGIGYSAGGGKVNTNGTSTESNIPSLFGLALHGGLPLVFATSTHFAFEVVPELNLGFVTGGWDDTRMQNQDTSLSGFLLELGARVGAEIQFGFMGIPQLALQGTVGLHMRYEGRGASIGNTDVSSHRFTLGTSVQGAPWDIFRSNIAAIYYF